MRSTVLQSRCGMRHFTEAQRPNTDKDAQDQNRQGHSTVVRQKARNDLIHEQAGADMPDKVFPVHPERLAELEREVERLRSALRALYDCQNGPPLLRKKHKDAWDAAMTEAARLLNH